MDMNEVLGTAGYAEAVQKFTEATVAIVFEELHRDFLSFIPQKRSNILDAGAGIGRDAAVLAGMGHAVTAVEPVEALRSAGKNLYGSSAIEWIDDALPELRMLQGRSGEFDFILVSGVWHHLDHQQQSVAMTTIAELLKSGGIFAVSLRNGPAVAGTHVFSTDGKRTIRQAKNLGQQTRLLLENQPSLMKNKENVYWTRLVFQKQDRF